MQLPTDPRERAIALLEANHRFPGPFEFRVVVRPADRAAALTALAAAAPDRVGAHSERLSANGNYVSLRVEVRVDAPGDVLDLYEVLRAVDGVITVL